MKACASVLQYAREYLQHRRGLGFAFQANGRLVLRFAEFADRSGWSGPLTLDLILRWVHLPKTAARSYLADRLSAVRGFARYLAARDGRTEVPDWRLLRKTFRRRPHIYSDEQLGQLLAAAARMRCPYELRAQIYHVLLGLLASTGLRLSEALTLTRGRVDLDHGILRIEQTKFKKSRLVPLHPTVTRVLRRYAAARDRCWGTCAETPFFPGPQGRTLHPTGVQESFRRLCNALGWHRGNGQCPRPRIHDLRHSFACRCLLRWYRTGADLHQRIAALSTYLGHGKVTDTYWYLSATPALLAAMASRFEQFASARRSS